MQSSGVVPPMSSAQPSPMISLPTNNAAEGEHPRDFRTRRRLNMESTSIQVPPSPTLEGPVPSLSPGPAVSPAQPSQSLSRQSSDRPLSRVAQRAMARASVKDSSSERSQMTKDVFRDDRGRRMERPRIVKADVHVIGEIVGASGFPGLRPALLCRYRLVYDGFKSWALAKGRESGCTQVSNAVDASADILAWEHPLDIHMTTQKLEGWPSLLLMVFARDDSANKDTFVSYSLCRLPNTPGVHHVESRTWAPVEPQKDNVRNIFARYVGMAPRVDDDLQDLSFVTDVRCREDLGQNIASQGSGVVHLRLQMLFRNIDSLTRQMGESLFKSLENFQATLEDKRRKEMHHSAALSEYQTGHPQAPKESAGLKQVREGREGRFEEARKMLERRGSRMSSQDGSHALDRSRSVDPSSRSFGVTPSRAPSDTRPGAQSAPPRERFGTTVPGVDSRVESRVESRAGLGLASARSSYSSAVQAVASGRDSDGSVESVGMKERRIERERRRQEARPAGREQTRRQEGTSGPKPVERDQAGGQEGTLGVRPLQ